MIVVLDTNVWISALQFVKRRGIPTRALEKAMSEDVIATCTEIEAEILRVLTEKFLWQPDRAQAALNTVLARVIVCGFAERSRSAATRTTTCSWNVQSARVPTC